MNFRSGLHGPLSVIHDGQAALITPGSQRIVLAAPLMSTNQAVSAPRTENRAQASCLLTTALSFWRGRAFGDVPSRTSHETP